MRKTALALVVVGLLGSTLPVAAKKPPRPAAEPTWGDLSSPIRPGASLGGRCTFNWVFFQPGKMTKRTVIPPAAYIGTAGHCTDEEGERVEHADLGEIGTVVYDSDVAESEVDFTLIRIDDEFVVQTNPAMLGWDGPKGSITTDSLATGDRVDVYGYGIGVGLTETTRPRYGYLVGWDEREYWADMPAVNGDSGAPLLHDGSGLALGIISRYGIAVPPTTDRGPMMPWILEELAKAGFKDLRLATIE